MRCLLFVIGLLSLSARSGGTAELPSLPPGVVNTQRPEDRPLSPAEALARITVPAGFNVSLFAGEPDVMQPIAFDFDDRGRLWVVECFSYPDFKVENRDRILIFTDTNGDGRFDERKVFLENGHRLSGIAIGFGGVWVTSAPHLLFYPDRDSDDLPDGKPEVLLDGWTLDAGHNMVNGLSWGIDGWLYGRHGITTSSLVGKPGTPEDQRFRLSCAIWRFHPTRRVFEVVAHGTTNPWGLDWDDFGQPFFSNNVIGHLWHLVPGAHYKRMFGEDFNPRTYQLMDQCANHLHWAGSDWTKTRGGEGVHGQLGGGHSHVGAMVYLGGAWPARYRNHVFMVNLHGNRVLSDELIRRGSGYEAQHGGDFLMANDKWFRGVNLAYGPDGGVFLSDWNDFGECHDQDGSYRTSGRIYKITYGESKPLTNVNLGSLSGAELVRLQLHTNEWFVRHSRRVLQERSAAKSLDSGVETQLLAMLRDHPDITRRLRALWTLHATDRLRTVQVPDSEFDARRQPLSGSLPAASRSMSLLHALLRDPDEHMRWWSIQMLCEEEPFNPRAVPELIRLAHEDSSAYVRLSLASALQRLPLTHRWGIAAGLLAHEEDAGDANLPLMIWYGLEPLVSTDQARALKLMEQCRIPLVRRFIARRIAEG